MPEASVSPVHLPYMVTPFGKVSPSIAAPPSASIKVPVPASSGNNCSVSATNPPLADANTVSSKN